ncbi:cupin domain-containing protein [Beijerinckia mobilis]|uniref:cupin domain-containing protein n=1 Tax=Beijerinckia mobilis TaxID=231434 RepID=UPI0009FF233B|nr:cupin domain-containing protein [Beijerinckia mobilis]
MQSAWLALVVSILAVTPTLAESPHSNGEGFIYLPAQEVPFEGSQQGGAQRAVIFGDPSKPGVYVIRVKFPPGVHSNPHFHSEDRHAVVISGTWWNGTGEDISFAKARPVKAGSYVFHPAGKVHWDGAGEEEAIIQITGIGPVTTTPAGPSNVHPADWPAPK